VAFPRIAHVVEGGFVEPGIGVGDEDDVFYEGSVGGGEGEGVGGPDAEGVGAVKYAATFRVELAACAE
jgi:hypothetical protein